MRLVAKRSEDVWLLTEATEEEDPPSFVRVLDRGLLRLYAPHPYADVIKGSEWEDVPKDAPSPDELLDGVEVMPADPPFPPGLNVTSMHAG